MNLRINPEIKEYAPKGRVLAILPMFAAEPNRVFKSDEISKILGCDLKGVSATLEHPIKNGLVYRMKFPGHRAIHFKGSPFDGQEVKVRERTRARGKRDYAVKLQDGWLTSMDDPRVPKVIPNWTPPKMVCVR